MFGVARGKDRRSYSGPMIRSSDMTKLEMSAYVAVDGSYPLVSAPVVNARGWESSGHGTNPGLGSRSAISGLLEFTNTWHLDAGGGSRPQHHKRTGQPSAGPSLPAIIETDADAFLIGLVLRNFVA